MPNGRDLVEMVCHAYVTPSGGEPVLGGKGSAAGGRDSDDEEDDGPDAYDFGGCGCGWSGSAAGGAPARWCSQARGTAARRLQLQVLWARGERAPSLLAAPR